MDHAREIVTVEWFGKYFAARESLERGLEFISPVARDDHDRQRGTGRSAAFHELHSAELGHRQIGDDRLKLLRGGNHFCQRGVRIREDHRAVAESLQLFGHVGSN